MRSIVGADTTYVVETPDGATIGFDLPTLGERAVAFFVDLAIAHLAWLAIVLAASLTGNGTVFAAGMVAAFLVRNFYFTTMELAFSGRTVGKMLLRMRVVARDGGPLTAQAVLARNLTRDLEWFFPLVVLIYPTAIVPAGPGWGRLLGVLWFATFMLLPLFNRQRLRVGDLIGGTVVIQHRRARLKEDLATTHELGADSTPQYRFAPHQLGHYGVLELQTLERVLRLDGGSEHDEVLRRICDKVTRKIGWGHPVPDPGRFLHDFYRAQRAHLEQRMLFGQRKESKNSDS